MNASQPGPSRPARLAVAVLLLLAVYWGVANIWHVSAGLLESTAGGGLGAVSLGVSEGVGALAVAALLAAVLLAFVRRKHDASAFERRLARTHLYVTLSYVASLVAGVLSLVLADRGNQIMTVAGISLLFLVWATVLPTQIFFGVAAMICAADRYLARSTPGLRTKH